MPWQVFFEGRFMYTTSIQMAIADVGELAERKLKTIDLPRKALPRWVWRVVQFLHLKKIKKMVAALAQQVRDQATHGNTGVVNERPPHY
jgi:hypothetical protein